MPQSKLVKKLDFIFFDAGGGHRAAANALRQVVQERGSGFQIRLVNLQELLDPLDVFRKITGLRLQDIYNLMLERGWTLGSGPLTAGMHLVIRMFHRQQVRLLEEFWRGSRPDMAVSLVPNFNRALAESLGRALADVPLVTVLTDIADYPPHFWLERPVGRHPGPAPQYVICGSDKAVEQARAMGHAAARVFRVSGMILAPKFYVIAPLASEQRAAARAALGFDPQAPVGLMLFGGQGAAAMLKIARRLPERQLIAICGHNEKLAAELRGMRHAAPIFVEGFTKEVPCYMQLADYFIGKPGPGSLSEAVFMRLPVIVERNAWTLPQERYNAEWIRQQGVGIVLRNFRKIARAVEELLDPENFARYRAATERMENRGVFEIAEILEKIIHRRDAETQG